MKNDRNDKVWLIWGVTKTRCDLIAIATHEGARQRYLEAGKRMGRWQSVIDESTVTDHMYGRGMLNALNNRREEQP